MPAVQKCSPLQFAGKVGAPSLDAGDVRDGDLAAYVELVTTLNGEDADVTPFLHDEGLQCDHNHYEEGGHHYFSVVLMKPF